MIVSLVYLLARRVIELLVLRARTDASKDVELLVLRHEVNVVGAELVIRDADLRRCWALVVGHDRPLWRCDCCIWSFDTS